MKERKIVIGAAVALVLVAGLFVITRGRHTARAMCTRHRGDPEIQIGSKVGGRVMLFRWRKASR